MSFVYTDDFIGLPKDDNIFFSHYDNESRFKASMKDEPNDWYYRDNPITYNRNRLGHRCKNIEDIDLNNYFLTTGCSNTEGIGLHLEDTYSYILSKTLNCDYYNLGLGGSGIDILFYNLLTWLSKVKQKPKFIVLQNPEYIRYSVKEDSNILVCGPWSKNHDNLNQEKLQFLVLGDEIRYFEHQYEMKKRLIKNIIDVPIIDVLIPNLKFTKEYQLENVVFLNNAIDRARDNLHRGRLSNKEISSQIVDKLQTLL